jgi:tRNA-dihydrouridine synthase
LVIQQTKSRHAIPTIAWLRYRSAYSPLSDSQRNVKSSARWEHIKEVVEIRNHMGVKTKIIGNGDVQSMEDGTEKQKQTGCDGIMIGRAALGNPWIFDTKRKVIRRGLWNIPLIGKFLPRSWEKKILGNRRFSQSNVSVRERLETLVEHSKLFDELLGDIKSFAVMKKHFKAYVNDSLVLKNYV